MAIGLNCNNPPAGEIGFVYSHQIVVTGDTPPDTFTISLGSLPPGLSIGAATGLITGTPTGSAGTSPFTVTVVDSVPNTTTVNCSITINGLLQIAANPANGYLDLPYSYPFIATGGIPPYAFQIQAGALPPGLSLNITTGVISGVPTVLGRFNFSILVTDSIGGTATIAVSITVQSTAQAGNQGPQGGKVCD